MLPNLFTNNEGYDQGLKTDLFSNWFAPSINMFQNQLKQIKKGLIPFLCTSMQGTEDKETKNGDIQKSMFFLFLSRNNSVMILQLHSLKNALLRTGRVYWNGIPTTVTGPEPSQTSVGAAEEGKGQTSSSINKSSMGSVDKMLRWNVVV